MLRNLNFILNVYAFANANIGYAQGMNFIVANSLFLFKDNVDAFYFLDGLIQLLNLEDFYGIKNKLKKKQRPHDGHRHYSTSCGYNYCSE